MIALSLIVLLLMAGAARAQDPDTITIPWPGTARAQDTITIPCSRVEEFLHGAIDVPPGASVTVTAHTLRSLTAAVGGPKKMARLMGTRVGQQWLSILKPITDEEFEWCSQRVQHELVRRQRERPVPRAELAVIPFTPGQPIYVDVRINDAVRARLVLDTGADRTTIAPRLLRAAGLAPRSTATMRGVTGQATVDVYEIASLEVSVARVGRLTVFAHDTAEPASDGLLGRDFLDHFTITIDNAGGQVTLSPKAKLAAVPPAPEIMKEVVREYGTLAVRGRLAGIEVWLDDRKLGETETGTALVMSNLPAGTYRLKARKAGHKDWEREVQVAANQRAEIVIDIEPLRTERPAALRTEDGAEMVLVPAGEFWMGSEDYDNEKPRHRVYLDAFYIDKYAVTNALYERFMRATGRQAPRYWSDSKWNGPTQPVVGVSWHDAEAYCKWAGKRLPTEAEWEKAARGTDGRKYPWGDQWDASRANSSDSKLGKTTPVGSYPGGASPYGALDMAGNVWQWVADWYDETYYQRSPERNPRGPESGQYRVLRGGSWLDLPIYLRSAYRDNYPSVRLEYFGFRCARGL